MADSRSLRRGFTPVEKYRDFAKGYEVAVGTPCGSGLFLRNARLYERDGPAAAGILIDGAWLLDHKYPGFNFWRRAAHAGNGFVLLYDTFDVSAAWGTLGGGVWEYYGTT